MRIAWLTALGAVGVFWSSAATAHIDLTYPPMRYAYTDNGQKVGPCGGGAATTAVTTFDLGETITVTWDETINHPGHFRISLDPDGADDAFVNPSDYDDFNVAPSVLVDNITDPGGSTFSQEITLPTTECEACSIQLIQVMTDKPPWGPGGGNDIYYWCADIRIQEGGGTGGVPNTGGSGTGNAGTGNSEPITGTSEDDSGCGVAGPRGDGSRAGLAFWLLGAGALLISRRRA